VSREPVGEYLTLTDSISKQYGCKITFERDNKGRIVAAVDPDGNKVRYAYDSKGDLVSVTDREGHTTRFEYSDTRKHYLTKVIDPLNRPVMRNEYDEMGRLTKVFDANGNAINMSFDPENQIQIVTDPLGNSTTYEYDDRGNTVQIVDALGGVDRFTYSADNKLLSATDAVGNLWQYSYDANGHLSQQILPSGLVLTYQNDASGRQTFGMSSTGEVSTYFYNNQETSPSKFINSRGIVYEAVKVGQNGFNIIVDGRNVGTYMFDGAGDNAKPLKIVDAEGVETNYSYDSKGRVTQERVVLRDQRGSSSFVTTYVYDDQANSVTITDPFGNIRVQTFNAQKLMVTESINGVSVTYKYDNLDRLEAVHYADGTRESVSYDALGRPITYTDREGRVYRQEFDALGRVTKVILPDGSMHRWEYDAIGRVTKEVYPDGSYVEKQYQKDWTKPVSEKIFSASGELLKHSRYEYDLNGRVSASIDIDGNRTEYRYTSSGIMSQIITSSGQIIDLSPSDLSGKPEAQLKVKDERGFTWQYESFLRQINAVIDAQGNRHEYTYNRFGKVDTFTDGEGYVTQYIYDDAGQEIARILPDGSQRSLSYSGNLVTVTDYNGNVFEREMNSDGFVSQFRQPDGTIWNYEYNELGLLTKVKDRDGNVLLSYTYDTLGRIISKVQSDGKQINYEYNELGLVTKVQNGSHVTTYTYDQNGLPTQVSDSLVGITRYEYDFANASMSIINPSGGREVQFFDRNGNVSSQRFYDTNGQLVGTFDYERNNNGLLIRVVKDDMLVSRSVVTYEYDSRGQLAKETYTDSNTARVITYRYDARGNRVERRDSAEGITTYTYGVNGQLLSESKDGIVTTYTYDQNGNLLRRANQFETTEFAWNLLNLLTSVTTRNSQGVVTHQEQYTYDPLGNRVGQRINGQDYAFLVDTVTTGYSTVREVYDPNGTSIHSYVYDNRGNSPLAQVAGSNKSFFLRDYRGSTMYVSDEQGAIQGSYQYDAFGRILRRTGSSDINHLYNGEWTDKTGLQYLRARYLNPDAGSFISRDPIYDGEIKNPLTRNQYLYGLGDPVNHTDPTGLFAIGELNVAQLMQDTLQKIKTWSGFSFLQKVAEALEKIHGLWCWFELAVDLAVDYLREHFPIGVNENLFLNLITTGSDVAYAYSKELGPVKVEWNILRSSASVNRAAGNWDEAAFYQTLSTKFTVETMSSKGEKNFMPGVAKYLGRKTYTTSGDKYAFQYELKRAISGVSYGSSLSKYDQRTYTFEAAKEYELWKAQSGNTESKWVWGVVGSGSLTYSELYGGFGRSSIRVGLYTQFSINTGIDYGITESKKYKLNIVGVEVAIKSNEVNTHTGEPLNPDKKPKLYVALRPFGDVVNDEDGNQQYTYDLSKLFGL
jgi:RHS repeat-associated protein